MPLFTLRFNRYYASSTSTAMHTVSVTYRQVPDANYSTIESLLNQTSTKLQFTLSCTCIGFKTGKKCKHSNALQGFLHQNARRISMAFLERTPNEMKALAKPGEDPNTYAGFTVLPLGDKNASAQFYAYNSYKVADFNVWLATNDTVLNELLDKIRAQGPGISADMMAQAAMVNQAKQDTPDLDAVQAVLAEYMATVADPKAKEETEKTPQVSYVPMLASALKETQSFKQFIGKPDWYLEEKYDGHRLLVRVFNGTVRAKSRPGVSHGATDRALPPHIVSEFAKFPDGIYDGELYIPGGTSTDVVRLDLQDKLRFVVFDILRNATKDVMDQAYTKRRKELVELFWLSEPDPNALHLAYSMPVTQERLDSIWQSGGEGAILKFGISAYAPGVRSPWWIKIKHEGAAQVTITGFEKGKLGPNSVALFRDKNGNDSKVKVLNGDILADIDKRRDEYIGKTLVISHKGYTSGGLYRHPVWDHVLWS